MMFYCANAGRRIDEAECGKFEGCSQGCHLRVKNGLDGPLPAGGGSKTGTDDATPAEAEKTKICSRCVKEKPISQFHNQKGASDGLSSYCKTCKSKINKQYNTPKKQAGAKAPELNPARDASEAAPVKDTVNANNERSLYLMIDFSGHGQTGRGRGKGVQDDGKTGALHAVLATGAPWPGGGFKGL